MPTAATTTPARTARQIGMMIEAFAKESGIVARVKYQHGGSVFIDHEDADVLFAAKRAVVAYLLGECGRKGTHISHMGCRSWYLDSGRTLRAGIRIELTPEERTSFLLGETKTV